VVILFMGLFFSQLLNIIAIYWFHSSDPSSSLGEYEQLSSNNSRNDDNNSGGDADHDDDNDGDGDGYNGYDCNRNDDGSVYSNNNKRVKGKCTSLLTLLPTNWHTQCNWLTQIIYFALLFFFVYGLFYLPLYEIKYVVMKKYTSINSYSVFSGVMHLLHVIGDNDGDNDNDNATGQYFLFAMSLIFVVILPLIQQLLVAVLWFVPLISSSSSSSTQQSSDVMSLQRILQLDDCLNVISHFSSLEVFLISSLFVSFELGSLLSNLALGKYLSIEITILPHFYVYFSTLLLLALAKYEVSASTRFWRASVAQKLPHHHHSSYYQQQQADAVSVTPLIMLDHASRGHSVVL
jgi:hypothetical protein